VTIRLWLHGKPVVTPPAEKHVWFVFWAHFLWTSFTDLDTRLFCGCFVSKTWLWTESNINVAIEISCWSNILLFYSKNTFSKDFISTIRMRKHTLTRLSWSTFFCFQCYTVDRESVQRSKNERLQEFLLGSWTHATLGEIHDYASLGNLGSNKT